MPSIFAVTPSGFMGGAEQSLLEFARAAGDAGWAVTVAVPSGTVMHHLESAGVATEAIPDLKPPSDSRSVSAAQLALRSMVLARTVRARSSHFDLIIANGILPLPAIRLAQPRCPVVHLVRDVCDRRRFQLLLRLSGRVATVSVAPSQAAAEPLRRLGLPVALVHKGTPWPVEPAEPLEHESIVGLAAYLTPLKAHDVVLEAIAQLDRPQVVAEFAGDVYWKDRAFEKQLRARAALPDLRERVRFLGFVDDVLGTMRRWRIAVLPSIYPESAGRSMLEAMSIGVPVVASDHGGPAELLGEAGLLVPPGDPTALADAIVQLLDDQELYGRCSRAGPRLVRQRYNRQDRDRALLNILAGAANDG